MTHSNLGEGAPDSFQPPRAADGSRLSGAHMSIAGGCFHAVEAAAALGMTTVQIFTKNSNQWRAKPLSDEEAAKFAHALITHGLRNPIAHASYLINLASPKPELRARSLEALVDELRRAEQLQLAGLVMHPGSYTDSTPEQGLEWIAEGVKAALEEVQPRTTHLLLENTAGQGTNLGWDIAQLGWLFNRLAFPDQLGICLDTCHAHAAGYDLNTESGRSSLIDQLKTNRLVERVQAMHINDSKKECGCRVDRHEHLGHGTILPDGFRGLLATPELGWQPLYLETPKGESPSGEDWDAVNHRQLRQWLQAGAPV
jgi:deoxyribonuclease IV